ncbi:MAG: hypothetical protein LUH04_12055 [Clostridium sp.]|nr:hypothetical protein [Clostridium sp.]
MHNTASTTLYSGINSSARNRTTKNKQGSKKGKTAYSQSQVSGNDYLKETIQPISYKDVVPLYSKESILYLRESAQTFVKLHGLSFEYEGENLKELTEYFESILPKGYSLSFNNDIEDKKQEHLSYFIEVGIISHIVYYVPCYKLEEYEGEFHEILFGFFQQPSSIQRLCPFEEGDFDYEWIMENMLTLEEEYDLEEDKPDFLALGRRYIEGGDIYDLLQQIHFQPIYTLNDLEVKIRAFVPDKEDAFQQEMIPLLLEGIALLRQDKSLLDYTDVELLEDGKEDNCYVSAEQLFRILYKDDPVQELILEYLNESANVHGSQYFLAGAGELSPEMKEPLKIEPSVVDFTDWLERFIKLLY